MGDVQDFFNRLAPSWDERCIYNREKIHTLLSLVGIKKQSRLLDVGCGTGVLESFLLEYEPEVIVAVDLSDEMIKHAKSNYQHPKITFICKDAMTLEEGKYDYIFIHNAFPHFEDGLACIKKMKEYLDRDGKLVICHSHSRTWINDHHEAKAKDVSKALIEGKQLARQMEEDFIIETVIDNEEMYMVVGEKKGEIKWDYFMKT